MPANVAASVGTSRGTFRVEKENLRTGKRLVFVHGLIRPGNWEGFDG
jgi:hypothetical protein